MDARARRGPGAEAVDAAARHAVLTRLPGDPRAVVARALALDEGTELRGDPEGEGFLLLHRERKVAHLAGAGAAVLPDWLPAELDGFTLFGFDADVAALRERGLAPERLELRALRTLERVPPFVGPSGPPPRPLAPGDPGRLKPLPPELAGSLEAALARPAPVYGVVLHDQVVSFACAFWVGDRWWDLSADTHPDYRRRGFGTACAVALIRAMAPRGLFPVNAPATGSGGAPGFLAYLGFEEAGWLVQWRPEG